jgi:N-acetylglucosamine-6-phosphate deacetylase
MTESTIDVVGRLYAPEDRGLSRVRIEDGRIVSIERIEAGPSEAGTPSGTVGSPEALILPGLIDIQLNGAFGQDFADPGADVLEAARRLPELGVTAFSPTVVTSAPEVYPAVLERLRSARSANRDGGSRILDAHFEGPFISPRHPGTHDRTQLRAPDVDEARAWLAAGGIGWVTLAPELPGALDLVDLLVGHGVRVSIGHTDATWSEAEAAAAHGATLATHLFNAMRPLHHRDPGVVGFALASGLTAGIIADGNHLAFETLRLIGRVKAPDELVLVTDALAGLGMPPGPFRLGDQICISDGTAGRLPDGTLSGSLLPLNRALRNLVEHAGFEPAVAVQLATRNPARALGLEAELGSVAVGRTADLAVLDGRWEVIATLIAGSVAYRRAMAGTNASSAVARTANQ